MATRKLSDLQKEAEEVRSRLLANRWDAASSDVTVRFAALRSILDNVDDEEVSRHVVVSSVAALQTHFRATIVSLCDIGEIYRARAAAMIPDKVSVQDALGWIGGSVASFGELTAHLATCNSVTDYVSWIGTLLQ
ncbi:conserved hypothetical protein, partial [Ricinus communis]